MRVQQQRCTCNACEHVFDAEIVMDCPIEVDTAAMKAVRCPTCGAGPGKVAFGGEIPASYPATDDVEERAARWWACGERGTSSETIFNGIASDALRQRLFCGLRPGREDRPYDPDDYRRCRKLFEAVPEWRGQLARVVARFPWWAPMADAWDEFDALWEEEHRRTDMCAPKLYAAIQRAGAEVDKLRRAAGWARRPGAGTARWRRVRVRGAGSAAAGTVDLAEWRK